MRVGIFALAAVAAMLIGEQPARAQVTPMQALSNATCLSCHGQPGFSTKLADGRTLSLFISANHFADSVHGSFRCTTCHTEITSIPHTSAPLSEAQWRQQAPKICGSCHTAELHDYLTSLHGKLVAAGTNVNAADCTDCHTAHAIGPPESPTARRAIGKACGTCHADSLASYEETYHGQMFALGDANAAMCADATAATPSCPRSIRPRASRRSTGSAPAAPATPMRPRVLPRSSRTQRRTISRAIRTSMSTRHSCSGSS